MAKSKKCMGKHDTGNSPISRFESSGSRPSDTGISRIFFIRGFSLSETRDPGRPGEIIPAKTRDIPSMNLYGNPKKTKSKPRVQETPKFRVWPISFVSIVPTKGLWLNCPYYPSSLLHRDPRYRYPIFYRTQHAKWRDPVLYSSL